MQSVNLEKLRKLLPPLYRAGLPVFLWGPSGAAKSTSVHLFVEEMRKTDPSFGFIDLRASMMDPVDVRGVPFVNKDADGKGTDASWVPFDCFPNAQRDGERGVLNIEELNGAPPPVQLSLYQLTFDRRIGDYTLPDGWVVWAGGNRDSDNGVTYQVPSPLANRFAQHILVEPTVEDFVSYGIKNGIRMDVLGFIRFRPDLLFTYDHDNPSLTFGTLRSYTYLSQLVDEFEKEGLDEDEFLYPVIQNCIGEGTGIEYFSFRKYYQALPDLKELIRDPEGAEVPTENAVLYAVIMGLFQLADEKNAGRIIRYATRLKTEFSVLLIRDCTKHVPGFAEVPEYVEWASKNHSIIC